MTDKIETIRLSLCPKCNTPLDIEACGEGAIFNCIECDFYEFHEVDSPKELEDEKFNDELIRREDVLELVEEKIETIEKWINCPDIKSEFLKERKIVLQELKQNIEN